MENHLARMTREQLLAEVRQLRAQRQQDAIQARELEACRKETEARNRHLMETRRLLENSRDQYRNLYEFAPVALLTLDGEDHIEEINVTGAQLLEAERDQLLGRPFEEMIVEDERTRFLEHMRRCRAERGPVITELHVQTRTGRRVPVELLTRPVHSLLDRGASCHLIVTDLTERKQAEDRVRRLSQALRQRTEEAEAQAAQLRELGAALTQAEQRERHRLAKLLHDHLQQLLAAAKMQLGFLCTQLKEHNWRDCAKRAESLLADSLESSRSLAVELSPPILRERGLIPGLEWLADWMHEHYNLRVNVAADPRAEPHAEALRTLLFEVARELLFNVVKHAGVGSAEIRLTRRDDRGIELCVEDRGIGFDPQQAPGTDDARTGFGLSSIRQRLELLHGGFEVESTPGEGTCITVHVPEEDAANTRFPVEGDPSGTLSAAAHSDPEPVTPPRPKIRVLLADDHRIVREGMVRLLQACPDIELVGEAEDGQQVVELARRLDPQVVVMDISMPGMNGIAATHHIRIEMPHVHIVGLSLYQQEEMAQSMFDAGAAAYLTKTDQSDQLVAAIRAVCNSRPEVTNC